MIAGAFLRAWNLTSVLVCAGLTAATLAVVPRDELAVPDRTGVASVIWPLVPVLFAMPIIAVAARSRIDVHLLAVRAVRVRARVLTVVLGCGSAALLAGSHLGYGILARNAAALTGAALLAGVRLPGSLSWSVLALPPMVMWLLGTRRDQDAYAWAVLLRPIDDQRALVLCLSLLVAGIGSFCLAAARIRRD